MKYFILFFFFPLAYSEAQIDSIISSDFSDFINLSANYYTSPLRFDSEDWIKFSTIVGITALSTVADKEIKNFSQLNQSKFSNNIFSADKYYYAEFVGASIIAFYGYGLIDNNNNIRKLAVKLTEATFLASSITLITKIVVGRARPYMDKNQYYTDPFTLNNDYNSFPSGHTTLVFAYSTVMANEIDNVFWKIGWYSLAGLVGYSRIYHNQHWFSDVLMSGAIGYFSGKFVNKHYLNTSQNTQVSLFVFPGGLLLQLRF